MAMLRAKQIKLNAAGDILVGGVAGAGTVLTKGAAGQVLKATAGGLEYANIAGTEVSFSGGGNIDDAILADRTRLDTAEADIIALEGRADAIESDIVDLQAFDTAIQSEVDAIELAVGLASDGTFVPFTGTEYLNGSTSITTALTALDTALEALATTSANDAFIDTGVGIRDLTATMKDAAINEVASKAMWANRTATVDPTMANDSTQGYAVGDVWVNGDNVFLATDVTANSAVWTRIDQNANAALFTYKGLADASEPSEGLAALEVGVEAGDTYKVSVAGDFSGALPFSVNVGDFILWNGTGWDKIDNTDPAVAGTAGEITVTGSTGEGFVVSIDDAYVGQASITTLGTITTGTWNGTTIAQANGGTGITTATVAGDQFKVLTVGATGALEYGYVTVLRDTAGAAALTVTGTGAAAKLVATNATVAGDSANTLTTKGYVTDALATLETDLEEQIAAVAAGVAQRYSTESVTVNGANAEVSVTALLLEGEDTTVFIGEVAVYINGVKLRKSGFTVGETSVTLVDSVNGYSAETGDVVTVEAFRAPMV